MKTITKSLMEKGYTTVSCDHCGSGVIYHKNHKDINTITRELSRPCCIANIYYLHRTKTNTEDRAPQDSSQIEQMMCGPHISASKPEDSKRQEPKPVEQTRVRLLLGLIAEQHENNRNALEYYIRADEFERAKKISAKIDEDTLWAAIHNIAIERTAEYMNRHPIFKIENEDSRALLRLQIYQCAADLGLESKFYERFGKKRD